jgi:hypothetical protein
VNSKQAVNCGGGGTVTPGFRPSGYSAIPAGVNYSQSMSCTSSMPTCNNIFYVKYGTVIRYTPVGSGGGRCFTDERLRPGFRGAVNY